MVKENTMKLAEMAMAHNHKPDHMDMPKKEVKEIRTRKVYGGHIHEHHHMHPEVHPMEEHMTRGDDEMSDHMLTHMGTPNEGEAEADAGQSGILGME